MNIGDFLADLMAVVVLYNRAPSDLPTLKTLERSLTPSGPALDLYIHDNSAAASDLAGLSDRFNITYRHDPANSGVSEAFNSAAKQALEAGKHWLLLLDQDTAFPEGALEKYCQAVARFPDMHMFGPRLFANGALCSPCGYRWGFGYHLSGVGSGEISLRARSIFNSGMLVGTAAFESVGGFDERIPLDFADHDFCRRFAGQYGKACILDISCEHGFSNLESSSLEDAVARFSLYCLGARNSCRGPFDIAGHLLVVLIRGAVLSLRYRSSRFLPVIFMKFMRVLR